MTKKDNFADEIEALKVVLETLGKLDDEQREFVFRTAGERLELSVPKQKGRNRITDDVEDEVEDNEGVGTHRRRNKGEVSPKEFMREKSARTDVERIACLAYYLTQFRETASFKAKDLTDLNMEAAQPKFSNAPRAVNNATNQNKYLASAGKGAKQITTLGEDVVDALPDYDAVTAVIASSNAPKRRKRRAKTSSAKTTRKAARKS